MKLEQKNNTSLDMEETTVNYIKPLAPLHFPPWNTSGVYFPPSLTI